MFIVYRILLEINCVLINLIRVKIICLCNLIVLVLCWKTKKKIVVQVFCLNDILIFDRLMEVWLKLTTQSINVFFVKINWNTFCTRNYLLVSIKSLSPIYRKKIVFIKCRDYIQSFLEFWGHFCLTKRLRAFSKNNTHEKQIN